MLTCLSLNQFALIDHHTLNPTTGFNVITGETGAGKSLILDALSLCLGAKAAASFVQSGQNQAQLSASFDSQSAAIATWFERSGRAFEGGEIVIRRALNKDGKSRAWLNGEPISLAELKTLGAQLVQLHSQHAGLLLLKPEFIREFLDGFLSDVGAEHLKQKTKDAFSALSDLLAEQKRQQQDAQAAADRIALLTVKLDDLKPLLGVDMAAAEQQFEELCNQEALIQDAAAAYALLDGEDDSATTRLARAAKICQKNSVLSPRFASIAEALVTAQDLLKDAANELYAYGDSGLIDEETLQSLNQQISTAHKLAAKYRTPINDLLNQAESWQAELDALTPIDADTLAAQIAAAQIAYDTSAAALTDARRLVADKLAPRITEHLVPLALPHANCQFEFTPKAPSSNGSDDVQLLFSANVGLPPKPLAKVASGGELSRIALVLQVLAASTDSNPVLVFDEVDVGISGGTAEVVGALLHKLGRRGQVLAITHQAQVAAYGDCHILVEKLHGKQQSQSTMRVLDDDARVDELARMSGGVDLTDETFAHAKSLLAAARSQIDAANLPLM